MYKTLAAFVILVISGVTGASVSVADIGSTTPPARISKENVAPLVQSFDASVIRFHFVGEQNTTVEFFVPLIRATVFPLGNSAVGNIVITSPDESTVTLPPNSEGVYTTFLEPMLEFSGGTFSLVASDLSGQTSKTAYDDVPPVTLPPPVLVNPSNNSVGVDLEPILDWQDVSEAKAYSVHLSTGSLGSLDGANWRDSLHDYLTSNDVVMRFGDEITLQSEYRTPRGRLLPEMTYTWAVGAIDSQVDTDQISVSIVSTFTTETGPMSQDTAPPMLTETPAVERVTETSITVTWKTDEASDTRVSYGTSVDALESCFVDTRLTKVHRAVVELLHPGTEYFLAIASHDFADNRLSVQLPRSVFTKAGADNQAPEFVNTPTTQQVRDNRATVQWTADELTTAVITLDDGVSPRVVPVAEASKNHRIEITGLAPGTRYEYEVAIADLDGNGPVSATGKPFYTTTGPDTKAPRILEGPVAVPSATEVLVYWTADESHSAHVDITDGSAGSTVVDGFIDEAESSHQLRLNGLNPATQYAVRVTLTDLAGNPRTSAPVLFRTRNTEDTTPPVLLSVPSLEYRSDRRVVIVWETDEPSDSYVRVTSGGLLVTEENRGALVRKHRLVITKLSPGQTYEFSVQSVDASGNVLIWPSTNAERSAKVNDRSISTFTTSTAPDTQYPVITSHPRVTSATATTLTITWQTDETANSAVYYGDASSGKVSRESAVTLTESVTRTDYVTTHSVTLTGLEPGMLYWWKVASIDPSGNGETTSDEISYQTLVSEDASPPAFLSVPEVIGRSDDRLILRWDTDEPANSAVTFRSKESTGEYESLVDPAYVKEHIVTLTNLLPSTEYELGVSSSDLIGNEPTSVTTYGTTMAVADIEPPVVSSITEAADTDQAVISWQTNEPADSWVEYGTTTAYGIVASKASIATAHEIVLTNLTPATQYFYRLASADPAGNVANVLERTFTTTGDPSSVSQPVPFHLAQNVPNPFNPITTIHFGLPESGSVRLVIYDVNGRLVRTLVAGHRAAGKHEAKWDARDEAGRAVASGVYVYRLTAGADVAVQRMVFVR